MSSRRRLKADDDGDNEIYQREEQYDTKNYILTTVYKQLRS